MFLVSIQWPARHVKKKQKFELSTNHACKLDLILYYLI
jgi:hypothetical protein